MNDALVIIPQGFEEIEAVCPINLMRRAGLDVKIAALTYPIQVTGRSRIELMADGSLDDYIRQDFSAIVLIGGPGYPDYRLHDALRDKLRAHKGLLAAICAAPVALFDAGLLEGKRYTCHECVRNELKNALNESVVVDGNLITAAGAGCAFEFGLKLVETLADKAAAEELAGACGYRR
jgi:4-methyl-5(b-hydroxyethyl)-thiazole monophosphate biosynthesis